MIIDERQLLNAKIAELLHAALVAIRAKSCSRIPIEEEDNRDELFDLADLLHNLPRYIVGHDEHAIDSAAQLRQCVIDHVMRFYPAIDPAQHHYVELLDMDEETFLARYRDHNWNWPEAPVAAAN
jgi:hypothetical protein